mmetsp:Transcript_7917/g.18367  ORF Transcript_7917/g.18367 Transcript_7917/m.18367 type:complete len:533 (-) Transcript_7917:68-1666(-)
MFMLQMPCAIALCVACLIGHTVAHEATRQKASPADVQGAGGNLRGIPSAFWQPLPSLPDLNAVKPQPPKEAEAEPSGQKRLRIKNVCSEEAVWIAHMAGVGTGPDPPNVKIEPHTSYDFSTPDNLASTRYWPKFRCEEDGNECLIGDSGGPKQRCRPEGCSPPVDTKFEATFGIAGRSCDPLRGQGEGCDWVDISLVDGYTAPFNFEIHGKCYNAAGQLMNSSQKKLDCSKLSIDDCPQAEIFRKSGANGTANVTRGLAVQHPDHPQTAGCYSPCSKLTLKQWATAGLESEDIDIMEYCCPTPPVSPSQCRAGTVKSSRYVAAVHEMCPGVYGYSYDDGMGLITCEATATYTLDVGCPRQHRDSSKKSAATSLTLPAKKKEVLPLPVAHLIPSVRIDLKAKALLAQRPDAIFGCSVGSTAVCPTGTPCISLTQCCPDGSTCPSSNVTKGPCPMPKSLNCVHEQVRPKIGKCSVGDFVLCPSHSLAGTRYYCSGDVCCPDGSTCPSASVPQVRQCTQKRSDCLPEKSDIFRKK